MTNLLEGYRVLELADRRAHMAGRVFCDLGAAVIQVEYPVAEPVDQAVEPAGAGGETAGLRAATHRHLNAGKRSVRLDFAREGGRALLRALLENVDVLITSASLAELEDLGLAPSQIESLNPVLVHVSLTPFGLDGPKSGWTATDEVALAAGGLLSMAGAAEGRPCVAPEAQGDYFSSYIAVLAAVAGLHARSTRPVVADVAMQEAVASQEHLIPAWLNHGEVIKRSGSQHKSVAPASIFPTADGYVFLFVSRVHWRAFLDCWPDHPPEFAEDQWFTNEYRRRHVEFVNDAVTGFAREHSTEEFVEMLQARGVPCLALQTPADYVHHDFARRRGFIQEVAIENGGHAPVHAAPFTVDGERPRPGPLSAPGSDSALVLADVAGLSADRIDELRSAGVIG